MLYFLSIHMVPLVPRGPVGKVYGDVPEACKPLFGSDPKRPGKGLKTVPGGVPGRGGMGPARMDGPEAALTDLR